ncbi:acyl carrier protein [Fulvivirga sp. 29W222]|uniref:Acyl carrier protein n=1 Tax=Fulvivirga marina TaxID=2494733 RepID=A0A937KDN9_9BACT|nr:acyl carrier protein [Fulvivirga marina]MBL6449326.1 acyl carrier protein [Fulvivirga marina]
MNQKEQVRQFIESNLIVFEDEADLKDDDNIFQLGYVNSLFAMKLLNYIESEFNVKIETDEMDIKNFSSVNNIIALLDRKLGVTE